ncbi:MAG: zf-HC2 domain-containing protein [Phycisphaerae bacterium]|nr:zf-HC2 domain-containing protein [Phycisphaerae bacterium]
MSCHKAVHIHAYHDGEASSDEKLAVEAHLHECSECRNLLADLQGLSRMLRACFLEEPPPGLVNRLELASRSAQDRDVRRLAGWMTAAAAAVLAITLAGYPNRQVEAASRTGTWELAAVMPPIQPSDDAATETVEVARWMVADLSAPASGEEPR